MDCRTESITITVARILSDYHPGRGSNGGGKPDIVAWRGESLADAVFLEYKGPNDRIRIGQDAWFRAALREGMSRDQFAVARWSKQ